MKNTIKDIETKTPEELTIMLNELNAQLHDFRFEVANMQLKNVSQVQNVRRNIARIETELKKRTAQNLNQTN